MRGIPGKSSLVCAWIFSLLVGPLHGGAASADDLYRQFQTPSNAYSLSPYWYWNGRINAEDTRREIAAMLAQGVDRAIVFPWDGMEQRYLSEDYWRQVGEALRIAHELHFTLNFADEYDWPSGHAWTPPLDNPELSKVLREHPEYRMRRLQCDEQQGQGPVSWQMPAGVEFAVAWQETASGALIENSLRLIQASSSDLPSGTWHIAAYRLVPAVAPHNTRVDLLNRDAVGAYIDLVYGEYARRFSRYFGNTLQFTVADHEGSYGMPIAYTPGLWKTFEARHGYDLKRLLPMLTHDTSDPQAARKLRIDYLDTISNLYAESFSKQVTAWCAAHGLKHATSIYEEQLYIQVQNAGDMFQHWRAGSLVEIDALLERARMPVDFKEAVSVAHFDHKSLLVENQGLQGHSTYFSLEKARLGTNMALLWGASTLIPYFDYDQKKITWPPQWFLSQPFWPYFHHYADYVRRVQFMNAQGTHVAPILIYYPLKSAFADSKALFQSTPHRDLFWNNDMDQTQNFYSALQLQLAREHWDYHIVDDYYLQRAAIENGKLRLGDEEFHVLILPPMDYIDPAANARISAFERAGGTVLRLGTDFPVHHHAPFMDRLDYNEQIQVPVDIQQDLQPLMAALRKTEPTQVSLPQEGGDHIYFSHRRQGSTDYYWFVNDSDEPSSVNARFQSVGRFEKWNAETGERSPLSSSDSEVKLEFGPWDAFFVVRENGPASTIEPRKWTVAQQIPSSGWRFTPESPHVDVPYAQDDSGNKIWLQPERLSNRDWWLIGPFSFADHTGFFTAYPPEQTFDSKATYKGSYGNVSWKWIQNSDYIVTLRDALKIPPHDTLGVYYAYANIYSPSERSGQIVTAFADSLMCWINGAKVLSIHRHPKWSFLRDSWAERSSVHLQQGWNTVLLKIGPSLMVPTAFTFRIVGLDGKTMRDLVYTRDRELPQERESAVQLKVDVPPGTVASGFGANKVMQLPSGPAPEHPVSFATTAVPFTLQSWTDSALAHYSGTAVYERTFEIPAQLAGKPLQLDLGSVGVAAEVWVNGRSCGSRVWRPFTFDITKQAHAGRNVLKIRVANSDAGWQSQGDTVYPKGSWGVHYKTELDRIPTLRPNGLEGPVRLLTVQ